MTRALRGRDTLVGLSAGRSPWHVVRVAEGCHYGAVVTCTLLGRVTLVGLLLGVSVERRQARDGASDDSPNRKAE